MKKSGTHEPFGVIVHTHTLAQPLAHTHFFYHTCHGQRERSIGDNRATLCPLKFHYSLLLLSSLVNHLIVNLRRHKPKWKTNFFAWNFNPFPSNRPFLSFFNQFACSAQRTKRAQIRTNFTIEWKINKQQAQQAVKPPIVIATLCSFQCSMCWKLLHLQH